MKVKCIKTSIANNHSSQNRKINNRVMDDYLSIGDEFYVYEITFRHGIAYFVIFNGEHLIPIPFELMEVIDNSIPDFWKICVRNSDHTMFGPELFNRDMFLENFAEREPEERAEFEAFRAMVEK